MTGRLALPIVTWAVNLGTSWPDRADCHQSVLKKKRYATTWIDNDTRDTSTPSLATDFFFPRDADGVFEQADTNKFDEDVTSAAGVATADGLADPVEVILVLVFFLVFYGYDARLWRCIGWVHSCGLWSTVSLPCLSSSLSCCSVCAGTGCKGHAGGVERVCVRIPKSLRFHAFFHGNGGLRAPPALFTLGTWTLFFLSP